ncbi:hypothetical protein ACFFQW_17155 [Umezawaea endophytica]|uniref:PPE family protein n=1 Tax=Umezawaea endophytica TaxID=1654476 RepID=A0A9X2VU80_9PSEU|nr:hypothetical protein [Umezawaea endophytica]MCS7482719.1 hypothetical protein [Umezawaea endophytica]
MPVGNHNFDAQSHQQLYDKIHQSAGAGWVDATNSAWLSFRAVMGNAKSDVEWAVRDAKAVWTGAANESFSGGMAPLVQWAENARVAGVASHNAFQAQQSYYGDTKGRMPRPVAVTSTANDDFLGIPAGFTHLVGGQTDQDVQERRANEAKREAVRMMTGYQGNAGAAVSTVGTFIPPPIVTLEVPPPEVVRPPVPPRHGGGFNGRSRVTDTGGKGDAGGTGGTGASPSPPPTPNAVTPPPLVHSGDQGTTHLSDAVTPPVLRPDSSTTNPNSSPVPPGPSQVPPGTAFSVPGSRGGSSGRGVPGAIPTGGGRSAAGGGHTGVGTPRAGGSPLLGHQPGGQVNRGPSSSTDDAHLTGRQSAAGGGVGAAGGAPQRGQGEDDIEHTSAEYLRGLDDVWGDNDVLVAPPVIGDDRR